MRSATTVPQLLPARLNADRLQRAVAQHSKAEILRASRSRAPGHGNWAIPLTSSRQRHDAAMRDVAARPCSTPPLGAERQKLPAQARVLRGPAQLIGHDARWTARITRSGPASRSRHAELLPAKRSTLGVTPGSSFLLEVAHPSLTLPCPLRPVDRHLEVGPQWGLQSPAVDAGPSRL